MKSARQEFVAEIEGEYGPLAIPECLVQKIWARGDFKREGLRTLEGAILDIVDVGRWNLLAGPDFKNIAIRVNGELLHGDAELHFFDKDWDYHGHGSDPAYQQVILHILVFPPKHDGRLKSSPVPHSLLLLDLLPQSLESYAEEAALGALTPGQSDLELDLLALPWEERHRLLETTARKRWEAKVRYAANRIRALGWEEACHQTALEIMGYRYNRSAMLFVAADFSFQALKSGKFKVEDLYAAGEGRWKFSGSRPANHPRHRLQQYLEWMAQRPDWPNVLGGMRNSPSGIERASGTEASRKDLWIPGLKKWISESILADMVGGSRIENLVCDGFLPLLAGKTEEALFPFWFHWYPGDISAKLKTILRNLIKGAGSRVPLSNGYVQGLIQLSLEKHVHF